MTVGTRKPSNVFPFTMSGSTWLAAVARGGATCSKKPPHSSKFTMSTVFALRPVGDGLKGLVQEFVSLPNVRVRVVVVPRFVVQNCVLRVHKGHGWSEDRCKVAIARRVVSPKRGIKWNIGFAVVTDRVDLVCPGAEKPVHLTVVVFHAPAVVGMIRVGMRTARVVAGKRMRRLRDAVVVDEGQAACLQSALGSQPRK